MVVSDRSSLDGNDDTTIHSLGASQDIEMDEQQMPVPDHTTSLIGIVESVASSIAEANPFQHGQFDDASETAGSFSITSIAHGDTVHSSVGTHSVEGAVVSVGGSSEFNTETGMLCWDDNQVMDILTTTLVDDIPQNVLDYRRKWPQPPIPDTRQLNRVLYKLRETGEVQECPPNGINQKPCWIRRIGL